MKRTAEPSVVIIVNQAISLVAQAQPTFVIVIKFNVDMINRFFYMGVAVVW